jgi:hypothetical protein
MNEKKGYLIKIGSAKLLLFLLLFFCIFLNVNALEGDYGASSALNYVFKPIYEVTGYISYEDYTSKEIGVGKSNDCSVGDVKYCELQSGVCKNAIEECINGKFLGCGECNYGFSGLLEMPIELSCDDLEDNDCDGLIDYEDSDCGSKIGGDNLASSEKTIGTVFDLCTSNLDCDDGNECVDDICDPGNSQSNNYGCVYINSNLGNVCDDGFGCTNPDGCDGLGVCVGVADDNLCVNYVPTGSICTGGTCDVNLYPVLEGGCGDWVPTGCDGSQLSKGLVLWMEFDDDISDGIATDSSNKGYDGTCVVGVDCPDYLATGGRENGGAYDFDGLLDFINVDWSPDNPIEGADQSYSLIAWVYTDDSADRHWIFGEPGGYRHFNFGLEAGDLAVHWRADPGAAHFDLNSGQKINGDWKHVAVTYDSVSDDVVIYVDGLEVANDIDTNPNGLDRVDELLIGKGTYGSPISFEYFDGLIDDIKIFDRSLDSTEVFNLFLGLWQGPPGDCSFSSAYWSKTKAVEGEAVDLIVEGDGCEGEKVNFTIADTLGGVHANLDNIEFVNDVASVSWNAYYNITGGSNLYNFLGVNSNDDSIYLQSNNILNVGLGGYTYYIDYDEGSDSGNGLTIGSAWKHCPGMDGSTGNADNYVPRPGDIFVFKGGVTWLNSALPLTITESGQENSLINYTVDENWYLGNEWSRPIFDAESISESFIEINADYILVDNFELKNLLVNSYGDFSIDGSGEHVMIQNLNIHDWHEDYINLDHKWGGINLNNYWIIDNCIISGDVGNNGGNGVCFRGADVSNVEIKNSECSEVPNAIVAGGIDDWSIHHNEFFNLHGSNNESVHENAMVCTNCHNTELYNNVVYNTEPPMGFYFGVTQGGTSSNIKYYNNLFYNALENIQALAMESVDGGMIYGNTLVASGSPAIRLHGTVPCNNIKIKNNIVNVTTSDAISIEGSTNMEIDYNNYLSSGGVGGVVWGGKTLTEIQTSTSYDSNSKNVIPNFENSEFNDYSLNEVSELIDAGYDLDSLYDFDLDDNIRSLYAPWDIGSYEFLDTGGSDTYYIDYDEGSDSGNGLTIGSAWKHCPGDANFAGTYVPQPGDTFIFKGDVIYSGSIEIVGDELNYIGNAWPGLEGVTAIIDGSEVFNSQWTQCSSQTVCGDNSNWQNIYYTTAPDGFDLFTPLYDEGEFLWFSQYPYQPDPFYFDEIDYYLSIPPQNIYSSSDNTSIVDPTYFCKTSSDENCDLNYYDNSYITLWKIPNVVVVQKILGYNPSEHKITFEWVDPNNIYSDRNSNYSVINNLHEMILDQPGEFYFDESNQKIYVWSSFSGNPSQRITYSNHVIGFNINGNSNILIEGFKIRGYSGDSHREGCAIHNSQLGSSNIIIKNNEVTKLRSMDGYGSIDLEDVDGLLVENNAMYENQKKRGVFVRSSSNVLVKNNYVRKVGSTGISFYTVTNGQVIGNTVLNNTGTHGNGMSFYLNNKNITIANNNVMNSNFACTLKQSDGFLVKNNIFNSAGKTAVMRTYQDVQNVEIYNNFLIKSNKGTGITINPSGTSIVIKNNIIDGMGDDGLIAQRSHNIYTDLNSKQSSTYGWDYADGEFLEEDLNKIFLDPDNFDFHLIPGSPAIDAGINVDVLEDIEGTVRPIDGDLNGSYEWDIGAYESQATGGGEDNYYIRDGATGNNDGSSWTDAWTDFDQVTWERGFTYWVADGNYLGNVFDTPENGEYIYIIKAIDDNQVGNSEWQSSYGDGQAIFQEPSERFILEFNRGYYILNGSVGSGDAKNNLYGFKVVDDDCSQESALPTYRTSRILTLNSDANNQISNIKLHHIEFENCGQGEDWYCEDLDGEGVNLNEPCDVPPNPYDQHEVDEWTNNQGLCLPINDDFTCRPEWFDLSMSAVMSLSLDKTDPMMEGIEINSCYFSGSATHIHPGHWSNGKITHSFFADNWGWSDGTHNQQISSSNSDNMKISHNLFKGNSAFIVGAHKSSCQVNISNLKITQVTDQTVTLVDENTGIPPTWSTNEWTDYAIKINGYAYTIESNTANIVTVTMPWFGVDVDNVVIDDTAKIINCWGSSEDWEIYNNIILDSPYTSSGFGAADSSYQDSVKRWKVHHNTIFGTNFAGPGFVPMPRLTDPENNKAQAYNNLFVECDNPNLDYREGITKRAQSGTIDHSHNTFFSCTGEIDNGNNIQTGKLVGTDVFENVNDDYHLIIATDHGKDDLGGPFNIDYGGVQRGLDGNWDRGAYEFVGGPPGDCSFSSAYWSKTKAVEGEAVDLIVEGDGCEGEKVNFTIADTFGGVYANMTNIEFVNDVASVSWNAYYNITGGSNLYNFLGVNSNDDSIYLQSNNILNVTQIQGMSIDPLLWLQFENNLEDSSGSGFDGQWFSGVEGEFVDGIFGSAVLFNASSLPYVQVTHNPLFVDMEGLTISAWVKKNESTSIGPIWNKHTSYILGVDGNSFTGYLMNNSGHSGKIIIEGSTTVINDDKWHQYVLIFNGSAMWVYVDNINNLVDYKVNPIGKIASTSTNPLMIGKSVGQSPTFDGIIDEFWIYNGTLDPEDVLGCFGGYEKECSLNLGICEGSLNVCYGRDWVGCNYTTYIAHNKSYEIVEKECSDGYDNDCDGLIDGQDIHCADCLGHDVDDDLWYTLEQCNNYPLVDCNDTNENIYPGAIETCDNGYDDDCDGLIDCKDAECAMEDVCGGLTEDFVVVRNPDDVNSVKLKWNDYPGATEYIILKSNKLGWKGNVELLDDVRGQISLKINVTQGDNVVSISNSDLIDVGEEIRFSSYLDDIYHVNSIINDTAFTITPNAIRTYNWRENNIEGDMIYSVVTTKGLRSGDSFYINFRDSTIDEIIDDTTFTSTYGVQRAAKTGTTVGLSGSWIMDYDKYGEYTVVDTINDNEFNDTGLNLENDYFYIIGYSDGSKIIDYSNPVHVKLNGFDVMYDAALGSNGGYSWKVEQNYGDTPNLIDGDDTSEELQIQYSNISIDHKAFRGFHRINLNDFLGIKRIEIIQNKNNIRVKSIGIGFDDRSILTFDLFDEEQVERIDLGDDELFVIPINKESTYVSIYNNDVIDGGTYTSWKKVSVYTGEIIKNPITSAVLLEEINMAINFSENDGKMTTSFGTDDVYDNTNGLENGWMLKSWPYTSELFDHYRISLGDYWPRGYGVDLVQLGVLNVGIDTDDVVLSLDPQTVYPYVDEIINSNKLKMGLELMKFSKFDPVTNELTITSRGHEDTVKNSYGVGTPVYFYKGVGQILRQQEILPEFKVEKIVFAHEKGITPVSSSLPVNHVDRIAILEGVEMNRGSYNVGDVIKNRREKFLVLDVDDLGGEKSNLTLKRGYDGTNQLYIQHNAAVDDVYKILDYKEYYNGFMNDPTKESNYYFDNFDTTMDKVIIDGGAIPWFIVWNSEYSTMTRGIVKEFESIEGVSNNVLVDKHNSENNDNDWWYTIKEGNVNNSYIRGNWYQYYHAEIHILNGSANGSVFHVRSHDGDSLVVVKTREDTYYTVEDPEYIDLVAEGVKPGDAYVVWHPAASIYPTSTKKYWQYNADTIYNIINHTLNEYDIKLKGKPLYIEFSNEPNLGNYGTWFLDEYIEAYNILAETIKTGGPNFNSGFSKDEVMLGAGSIAGGLNPGNKIIGASGDYDYAVNLIERTNYLDFLSHHRYYMGSRVQKRENSWEYWMLRNHAISQGKPDLIIMDSEDSVATAGGTGSEEARHAAQFSTSYWLSNFINSHYGEYGELGRLGFIFHFRHYSVRGQMGIAAHEVGDTTTPYLDLIYWPILMYKNHTSSEYENPDTFARVIKGWDNYGWVQTMGTTHGITGQKHVHFVNKKGTQIKINLTLYGVENVNEAYMDSVIGGGSKQTLGDGFHELDYAGYQGKGAIVTEPITDFENIILEPYSANIINLDGKMSGECDGLPDGTPCSSDTNECTDDICLNEICEHPNSNPGTGCDDGFGCTNPDGCDGLGVCVGVEQNSLCVNYVPSGSSCTGGICDVNLYPALTEGCGGWIPSGCENPQPQVCQFTDAYWSKTEVIEGEAVDLIVEGTNCDLESVNFTIADTLGGVYTNMTNIEFVNDVASVSWNAYYNRTGGSNNYNFMAVQSSDYNMYMQSEEVLIVDSHPYGCGDGAIGGNEVCDGLDFGDVTCDDILGYSGGSLECLSDCSGYNASSCEWGTIRDMYDIDEIMDMSLVDLKWTETVEDREVYENYTVIYGWWSAGNFTTFTPESNITKVEKASMNLTERSIIVLPWGTQRNPPTIVHGLVDAAHVYLIVGDEQLNYAENISNLMDVAIIRHGQYNGDWEAIGYPSDSRDTLTANTYLIPMMNWCELENPFDGNYLWILAEVNMKAMSLLERIIEEESGGVSSLGHGSMRGASKEGSAVWTATAVDPRIDISMPGRFLLEDWIEGNNYYEWNNGCEDQGPDGNNIKGIVKYRNWLIESPAGESFNNIFSISNFKDLFYPTNILTFGDVGMHYMHDGVQFTIGTDTKFLEEFDERNWRLERRPNDREGRNHVILDGRLLTFLAWRLSNDLSIDEVPKVVNGNGTELGSIGGISNNYSFSVNAEIGNYLNPNDIIVRLWWSHSEDRAFNDEDNAKWSDVLMNYNANLNLWESEIVNDVPSNESEVANQVAWFVEAEKIVSVDIMDVNMPVRDSSPIYFLYELKKLECPQGSPDCGEEPPGGPPSGGGSGGGGGGGGGGSRGGGDCNHDWVCTEWEPDDCPASGEFTRNCLNHGTCKDNIGKPTEVLDCSSDENANEVLEFVNTLKEGKLIVEEKTGKVTNSIRLYVKENVSFVMFNIGLMVFVLLIIFGIKFIPKKPKYDVESDKSVKY